MARKKTLTALDIAKDVLELLEDGTIKPKQMTYCKLGSFNLKKFSGQFLQKAMADKNFKPCEVCGIGAMFIAYVDKENQVDVPDLNHRDSWGNSRPEGLDDRDMIVETLSPYISEAQLGLIEDAFEVDGAGIRNNDSFNDTNKRIIAQWSKQFKGPKAKLIAICENMIANKGIFKPAVMMAVETE